MIKVDIMCRTINTMGKMFYVNIYTSGGGRDNGKGN
jgi:hypothetical protein